MTMDSRGVLGYVACKYLNMILFYFKIFRISVLENKDYFFNV